MRGRKKQSFTLLYVAIAICLVVSGVAVYGLVNHIGVYRESEEGYADIQAQALHTIAPALQGGSNAQTGGTAQGDTSATGAPASQGGTDAQTSGTAQGDASVTGAPASQSGLNTQTDGASQDDDEVSIDWQNGGETDSVTDEPEGEEVEDDALLWMLENQNSTWQTAAPVGAAGEGASGATAKTTTGVAVEATSGATVENTTGATVEAASSTTTGATVEATAGAPVETASGATAKTTSAPLAQTISDAIPSTTLEPTAIPIVTPASAGLSTSAGSANPEASAPTPVPEAIQPSPTALSVSDLQLSTSAVVPLATLAPTITPAPTDTPAPDYLPKEGISMERAVKYEQARYYVDFDYLTRVNTDVVGWLMQEGTDINYPVVRGTDNEYYLTHMMDGSINKNGSLFLDCGNSAAFIDEGSYVYGHNSKNGGMFALLSNYVEQSYYDKHPQMLLMSPFADYQIDIFAGIQTTVDDETSWRVKIFDEAETFDAYVSGLCEQSLFTSDETLRPLWGDKLLVLVTCTNIEHGERYVIYGRMRPIVYESAEAIELTKVDMDSRPTENGMKQVGELGSFMVYSQNDELWKDMRYESRTVNKQRKFGDGGCGPTAVATILANLVAPEKLPLMIGYADYQLGYTFCQCSVNRYYCNHLHAQYQLKTADEFLRYLPLAVANYAAGNNMWEIQSRAGGAGTNMRFLESLCLIYRLRLSATRDLEASLEQLKQGGCLVMVSVSYGPFTTRGHYLVLAGMDDEYLYIIDPYKRDSYSGNSNARLLELIEPGIVRVKLGDVKHCCFNTMYIFEKTNET